MDAGGPYYPLVSTLFWSLREPQRALDNVAWLRTKGYDGPRILYDVDWSSGLAVHGTPDGLSRFLDSARGNYGARTKITVTGGSSRDKLQLAREVRDVVRTRLDSVILLEAANEGNASRADAIEMAKILNDSGALVSVGLGDQGIETIISAGNEAGASVDSFHIERSGDAMRWIRQGWDHHSWSRATDRGEDMGPASSSVQTTDPFILATLRAGSIINGAGLYCLHTGDGVFGYSYAGPTGWRYANLYDRPNADTIYTAVRTADQSLYLGMENWAHANNNLPMEVNSGPIDKQQMARSGKDFVILLTDTGNIDFAHREPIEWYVTYDPSTGVMVDHRSANLRAYVLVGRTL